MTIEELSKKIDKYHEQDVKRAKNYRYQSLSYILWGFALAAASLFVTTQDCVNAVAAALFVIWGFVTLWYSAKFKVK